MKKILYFFLLSALALFIGCKSATAPKEPIKALIVTGQNNHNWQVSHVALQKTLENSGLFQVDLAVSPKSGEDMSSFILDFSKYGVVVLDYNGDNWPQQTNDNFLKYVNDGGGVIIVHAADNAFREWTEFQKVLALGGWGNRNETDGPYVYLKEGVIFKDTVAGPGGSHGAGHEYVLDVYDAEHPITKVLPAHWKHAHDELYDRMRGPANIKSLLYTAFSDESTGGTGRSEPLIFTVDYGKGRIMHTMLGHPGESLQNNTAMQCTGFQVSLLMGAEWAATGEVTQTLPADFPTADKVSLRPDYKAPAPAQ